MYGKCEISAHLLTMEVDFCPVLCIPKVPVSQDFRGISHFVLYCKAAREREEVILKQLEEKEPLPDKEADQMAWVRAANQHRAIAEEIILKELIYV